MTVPVSHCCRGSGSEHAQGGPGQGCVRRVEGFVRILGTTRFSIDWYSQHSHGRPYTIAPILACLTWNKIHINSYDSQHIKPTWGAGQLVTVFLLLPTYYRIAIHQALTITELILPESTDGGATTATTTGTRSRWCFLCMQRLELTL